jgi:Skp family chaperone for outer membrane proteins
MKKFFKTLLESMGLLTETTISQTQQSQGGFQGILRHLQSIYPAVGDIKQVLKELQQVFKELQQVFKELQELQQVFKELQELRLEVTALKNQSDEKKQYDESNSLQRYYRPNQSPFRANSGYVRGQADSYAGSQYVLISPKCTRAADF